MARPVKPRSVLLPLLFLTAALALAAAAAAQERHEEKSRSAPATSFEVTLRTAPHWVSIHGTVVREIREKDRPAYDMFHYGSRYYVYANDRWYVSRRWHGRFVLLADRKVPAELRKVPREHWRRYPAAWEERHATAPAGPAATLRITFRTTPRWALVRGTHVDEIPMAERPAYDVFRCGGAYYAYSHDRWYMSHRESGDFTLIEDRAVPTELSKVPRDHWRTYPAAWQNPHGTPPGLEKKGGVPPGQEKKSKDARVRRDSR
jgi:hypothetical protein